MATKQPPPQQQSQQPGRESEMTPQPESQGRPRRGSGKLQNKVALITGGDSGIGRAVAIAFAREGADVAILYLNEHEDAAETRKRVEGEGRRCLTIAGDIGDEAFCHDAVRQVMDEFDHLEILVNNAAEQHPQDSIEAISAEQLERTFRTNIFGMFFMTKAALPHLKEGSAIVNTTSVTAYQGNPMLLDYSFNQGCDRRVHPLARAVGHRAGHPRQRRRPRPHLDAAHPLDVPARQGREVRPGRADEAPRTARRGRRLLRLPRLR